MKKHYTKEEKRLAFQAYNACHMSDEQLDCVQVSMVDLINTVAAMGENGCFLMGFHQMLHSVEMMKDARARYK